MKNQILAGLTIMTLMFAGCSRDEVSSINESDANSIGFELSTGKTRADVVDLGVLQRDADGFGVFATNGSSSATFIDNKAYKYEGDTWKWAELNMLWPTQKTGFPVNFYAYYPLSKTALTKSLTADYRVEETPENQVDYLAANQVGVADKPISRSVLLTFRHILSKIDFMIVTGSKVTVEVQSITIRNVGNSGTFNHAILAWTTPPYIWNSSFSYMTAPLKAANTFAGQTSAKAVTGSSGSLMLMPQNLSGRPWNKESLLSLASLSYIEVVYRVYETDSGTDVIGFTDASEHEDYAGGVTGPLFVKVGYPLPTDWLMGKAYAYTIHIGDGSSGGNLIEENFIDENGNVTDLIVVYPETGEPIEPPGPIFPENDVIGFVVNTENWGVQEENPLQ